MATEHAQHDTQQGNETSETQTEEELSPAPRVPDQRHNRQGENGDASQNASQLSYSGIERLAGKTVIQRMWIGLMVLPSCCSRSGLAVQ